MNKQQLLEQKRTLNTISESKSTIQSIKKVQQKKRLTFTEKYIRNTLYLERAVHKVIEELYAEGLIAKKTTFVNVAIKYYLKNQMGIQL